MVPHRRRGARRPAARRPRLNRPLQRWIFSAHGRPHPRHPRTRRRPTEAQGAPAPGRRRRAGAGGRRRPAAAAGEGAQAAGRGRLGEDPVDRRHPLGQQASWQGGRRALRGREGGAGHPTGTGRCDTRSRSRTRQGRPVRRRGRRAEIRAGGADASRAEEIPRRSRAADAGADRQGRAGTGAHAQDRSRRDHRGNARSGAAIDGEGGNPRRGTAPAGQGRASRGGCCPAAGQSDDPAGCRARHARGRHSRDPRTRGASSSSWPPSPTTRGANALAGKLKKSGYAAYVEPVQTSRGTLWRVRVGGYAARADADAARAKLKAEGQNGIVVPAK
ncbi:MAG: SPOR domain-containing protein [Betaproteobacteria bacterium]|nr:SPOR domain-containing protein [Betaproteobacteria bacterium]